MIRKIYDWLHRFSKKPWASFEVVGFENEQLKVQFSWNPEMIRLLKSLGYQELTEEDMVQMFFYMSQMKPTHINDDEPMIQELTPSNPSVRIK